MPQPDETRRSARRRRWGQLMLRAAERLGLLRVVFRLSEWYRARRGGREIEPPDGLRLPPAKLRVLVTGTPDSKHFVKKGRLAADLIRESIAREGLGPRDVEPILDFGCGCGRVTRHWANDGAQIIGTDYNPELLAWVRGNLPFVDARENRLEPPLPCEDGEVGLAYALSVFTHLTEPQQAAWINELARVVRPGGFLYLTTHGDYYADRLSGEDADRYAAGELVVRHGAMAGSNVCSAHHPPGWAHQNWGSLFEVRVHEPAGARGNGHQDAYLLRRLS